MTNYFAFSKNRNKMRQNIPKPTKLLMQLRIMTKQILPLEKNLRTNKIFKTKLISMWIIASVSLTFEKKKLNSFLDIAF